jgi:MFS family permease
LVSNIGSWMQRAAQDWLVLTILTDHSSIALGITTALQFAPALVLALVAGAVADRFNRRRILMLTQSLMGLLGLTVGLLVVTHTVQLWHVYVLALGLGLVMSFDSPTRQSFVTELVSGEDLTSAVGINSGSFNSGRLIGPGVAGLLIAWVGVGPVFLINAASFGAVLLALFRIRVSKLHLQDLPIGEHAHILDGIRHIRRHPRMVAVLIVMVSVAAFGLNLQVLNALVATQVFNLSASEYGLLGSILAIGSLSGALLAGRRVSPNVLRVVYAGVAFGLLAVVAAWMPSYLLYAAATVPLGAVAVTLSTSVNSRLQLESDPSVRGRVMAIYLLCNQGGTAIGAPIIGVMAAHFGVRWAYTICGLVAIAAAAVAALYLWCSRSKLAAGLEQIVR